MKRLTLIVNILFVATILLSACATPTPEIVRETVVVEKEKVVKETVVVEKEIEKEVTPTPAHTSPVTLVYWSDPRFTLMKGKEDITQEIGDYERLLAEEFMKMHPNVTIEVDALAWEDLTTKVTAAIAADSPPDVLKDYLGLNQAAVRYLPGMRDDKDRFAEAFFGMLRVIYLFCTLVCLAVLVGKP